MLARRLADQNFTPGGHHEATHTHIHRGHRHRGSRRRDRDIPASRRQRPRHDTHPEVHISTAGDHEFLPHDWRLRRQRHQPSRRRHWLRHPQILFNPKTNTTSIGAAIDLDGGFLYGQMRESEPVTRGVVTGGTGTYRGATGTITAKPLDHDGTMTAVIITYHK